MRLVGDVRLRLGAAAEEFIERMFQDQPVRSVVVDLSDTEGIDSTALGVLARLATLARKRRSFIPTLVSTRADITRLLVTMGFDDIFHIIEDPLRHETQLGELPETDLSPDELRCRVLAAHRNLMSLNEGNREEFEDLVAMLEASA